MAETTPNPTPDPAAPAPGGAPAGATPPVQAGPPSAAEGAQGVQTIQYEDFAKLDLRVGTVLEAKPAPKGDRLLVLQVDLGTERRQILAGIRQHVSAEQMVGRQIVIVANLAPRQMMGLTSQGMLLAATDPASGKVIVVTPSDPASPGSKVS